MAINEKLIVQEAAAGVDADPNIMLDLNAGDVDSYDGDGDVWYDIHDFEFKPTTNVSEHFNTVTWSGDGASTRSITGVGFQPDLVWAKARQAQNHTLYDSVRGTGKYLASDGSIAENTSTTYGQLTSFDSDGFTGSEGSNQTYSFFNSSSQTYVAWCFNAGGNEVTNTEGTVDSTVRANNDLGFSIVKYNGLNTAVTAGHGLDSPPEMVICKPLVTGAWAVWHKDMASDLDKNYIPLTTGAVTSNASSLWNYSNWGATKIGSSNPLMFGTNNDIVAYCFTSKRGVSKVGSFIGTGTSGNKIYTGFEPAFVMWKNADNSASNSMWFMFDNVRGESAYLMANSSSSEGSDASIQFHRDGFTVPNAGAINNSGQTHIYYAVAKNTNETSLHNTDLELNLEADSYSGSGNWLDSSGNGNNGTITGATWEKELGNFFEFNGSSDKVEGSISGIGSQFTVELWVSPNDFTGNENLFELYDSATATSNNRIFFSGGSLLASKNGGGGGFAQKTSITSVMTIGKWHHVVARYDSNSSIKLYVDTVKVAEDLSVSGTFNIANFAIGVNNDYTQGERNFANAKIGQVRVYDTILTEAQIRQNFNFTKPKYPNEFHFDKLVSPTWNSDGYFDFNGSGDSFQNTSTTINKLTGFSLSIWFRPNSSSDLFSLINKYGANDKRTFSIYRWSGTDSGGVVISTYYSFSSGSGNAIELPGNTFSANTWYHLVLVADGVNRPKAYINNVQTGTSQYDSEATNKVAWYADVPIIIGKSASLSAYDFNGRISKVKMFKGGISEDKIEELYNEGY